MKVLHTILAPKDADVESIRKSFDEETQELLKFDKESEFGQFKSYEQLPRDMFKEDSLELVSFGEIKALAGTLKEEKQEGFVAKLFKKERPPKEVIAVDEDAVVEPEEAQKSMSYAVEDQLWALIDGVSGVLRQEGWDATKKVKTVRGMLDAFSSFLQEVLSVSKADTLEINIERKEEVAEEEEVEAQKEDVSAEKEVVKEEAGKEETAVEEPEVEEVEKEETEPAEVEDVQKEEDAEEVEVEKSEEEDSEDALDKLVSLVGELTERLEKLEKSLPTVPEVRRDGDDIPTAKKKKDESVFKGIFIKFDE